jgi:sterol desaturase/sphingolipid hydroxylase (fatty acid hydroxylase superfamily)
MYYYENILLPFYASWLYCVASYYDYAMNPILYRNYPALFEKIDTLFVNVFFWLPGSLCLTLTLQPVDVLMYSPLTELGHGLLNILAGDLWFYTLHRLCHHPLLYFLHRQHHEVIHPIGVLALYSHPFDAIIINVGSILLLHLLIQFSFFQVFLIGSVATISTIVNSHTGRAHYEHQTHHIYRNCNYGVGLFMDRLFFTTRISK